MAKNMLRRMLSFILVFALLAPTIFELPVFSITASAATELALSVNGLSASYETSGSANSVWSADGNKLSYAGNSYASGCSGYNYASCTLTLTNTSGRPGLLEFSYSCSSTGFTGTSTTFNVNGNNNNLDPYDSISGSFKDGTAISLAPGESITVYTYLNQGATLSATLSNITLTLTGYTITNSLKNISSSNTASYVDENSEYTTTLTPANGYMLPETIEVTMGGTELSSGYTYDSATGSLTIPEVTGDVVITAAGIAKTWSLAVTEDHTFAEVHAGYTVAPAAETFTIENTGNQDAANLTVTLSGDNADSFTLNRGSLAAALSIGDATSFTVQPVTGLDAGTYTAKAVITADNISESVSLSFTVSAHVFNEADYTVTKKATCTEAGEKTATCAHSGCTATDTKVIEALGHDYHAVVTAPTCEEKGYTTYTCTRCNESFVGDEAEATGHTWGEWETVTAPSCESGGYRTRSCAVCGKIEEEQVSETGHTWDTDYTVDKKATCTTDGSKSIHCSVCGAVKDSVVIPATGHSFTKYVSNNNATCTGDGTKTAECDHGCGATDTETNAGTALGHDFTAGETVAATCTSEGYTLYTCTRCSETEKRNLTDALGHTPGAAATCTTDQVCTVCTTILAGKFGHTAGAAADCTTDQTCTACGAVLTAALGHTAGEAVTENENAATCTEAGSYESVIYCTACNAEISRKTVIIGALGHTAVTDAAVSPTCTADGLTEGSHCSVCGEVFTAQEVIPAKGHDYIETVTEPTCTSGGYTTYTCSTCGYSYTDKETSATGHDWSEWVTVTEPSCEGTGYQKRTCKVCGEVEESGISETGHTWETVYTVDKKATCTTDGSKSIHCSVCGAVKDSVVIPATGHSFTAYSSDENATCTENGTKTAACDHGCGETNTVTDSDSALGHDYQSTVIAPTCTESGYTIHLCSRCSDYYTDSYTEAAGHTFGEWTTVSSETCEDDGLEERTCLICGEVENNHVPASGHTWESGYTVDKTATCTTDGSKSIHCSACNAVKDSEVIPAAGHTYVLKDAVAATCTTTGLTEGAYCSACNEVFQAQQTIPALGHRYLAVTTNPSCTEAGYTTYTCTRCKESYSADETPATGHTWGEWVVVQQATCASEGLQKRTCKVCGAEEEQAISAASHTWDTAFTIDKEATCTTDGSMSIHCLVCGAVKDSTVIPATGHSYGSPVFTWANDGKSCTAIFTCINDENHVETVTAGISSASETTLLASVSFEGETQTSQYKIASVP